MIVQYLKLNRVFCFSVPNGGKRNAITGSFLKKEGQLAGVSDLIILLPKRCVFVEIKTSKGKQQDTQKVFEKQVKELGFEYLIWRSLDDAINFLREIK